MNTFLWPFVIVCINLVCLFCFKANYHNLFYLFIFIFVIQVIKEIYWYFVKMKKEDAVEGVDSPYIYNKFLHFFTNKKRKLVPIWFDPTLRLLLLIIITFYFFKIPNKTLYSFILLLNVILYYLNTFAPISAKPILIFLITFFCILIKTDKNYL